MSANELAPIISRALAEQRRVNGWTKEQQARYYEVDPATIWRWERGETGKAAAKLILLIWNTASTPAEQAA